MLSEKHWYNIEHRLNSYIYSEGLVLETKKSQIYTPDYINENHWIIKKLWYDFILTESYKNSD